jgi:hypothetical protein
MKLLHNANIHTLDVSQPRASAILLEGSTILAVGSDEVVLDRAHGPLERRDMHGATIWPGLTDAHLHIQHYALSLLAIDCETEAKEACLLRVAERAGRAQPGEWILGHGWNQNSWPAWPTAADLDAVAPRNPVYLTAKSLHAAWANTAALRLADISNSTPNPRDGEIQRDAAGAATGILLEWAMQLVGDRIPEPGADALEAAIEAALPALWRVGLTGVHDFDRRAAFHALQGLHARGRLKLRVVKNLPVESLSQAAELGLRTGFGDEWLWIGGMKAFMDGALGPRTAAMLQPYVGEADNRGMLNMDGEELFEHGRRAADAGLSMTVHAIGDRANHEALDAFEQLRRYEQAKGLPHLRHRIEHVQVLHKDDSARLAQLDLIASMQPLHATSDMLMAIRFWGERSALAYAWRTQTQAGARLAFGSDAPVESPNPFTGLHAAVTRQRADGSPAPEGWYPAQRLTLAEALQAYTLGAAYAANAEGRLGMLRPGFAADLIVLERDPFDCQPSEILAIKPSATMIAGEWVWQA